MLTDEGALHIKRFMGGEVGTIASSIAVGLGATAPTATDTALAFEFERADITLTSYDFANNRLVFKAVLPSDFSGKIYEMGLWTMDSNDLAGEFGSRLLVSFDSDTENWATAAWNSTNTRIGIDSLRHTPGASATSTSTLSEVFLDFQGNSGADKFLLAYNNANANVASITLRFKTDASNYYSMTISSPATGYNVSSVTKGSMTVTGTPTWENVTEVEVRTTATAGGSATVDYDGLRLEDVDTSNPDYVLIARNVVTPFVKDEGKSNEIEFTLAVSVSG